MATRSDARAIKFLNKSSGRCCFVFKTFSQRMKEIDIDVYRSLDPVKAEPSQGSSFFCDSLVEYRELNTAKDFISFYEEIFPLVQTLPQIILQKDLIISSLLSRLNVEGWLSLEPILRLIAVLSRDLLGDFIPFLQRIADSLESLLEKGADKDPEIIEQIFTSWSYIMMHLLKYLVEDVDHVLRITAKLRYYHKDHVREFMAESLSFLFRKAPFQQLEKGIMILMTEVVEEPSEMRKSGVGALLSHIMRITSSRLHSRIETLMPVLVDDSSFQIGNQSAKGSTPVLEVLVLAFGRLYAELDPMELPFIWKCLMEKITDSATNGNSIQLSCVLTLLISIVQNDHVGKITDCESLVKLVGLLVQTIVVPCITVKVVDPHTEVIEKVLQLMLSAFDSLSTSKNIPILLRVSSLWEPVFDIRSRSLLTFVGDLLMKDPSIFLVFETNILRAFNNLIEISDEEELVYLMMKFCEKLEGKSSSFVDGKSKEKSSRIFVFFEETLHYWIGKINEAAEGNLFPIQQNKLAVLWAVVGCYSHFPDAQENPSLLMDLINAIDKFLTVKSSVPRNTWHTLIAAALRSYHKFVLRRGIVHEESAITKFLDLARRHKLSPQILSAIADILDSLSASFDLPDTGYQFYLPECMTGKLFDALDIFAGNLSHANKEIRLSTLRILCRYEPIFDERLKKKRPVGNNSETDVSETNLLNGHHNNVLNLIRSVESTTLSIGTSRKVILLISEVQMGLSAHTIADQYMLATLNGIIGMLHNRFSYLWNPVLECLSVLIGQYRMAWNAYVKYLRHCQSDFLACCNRRGGGDDDSSKDTGLIGCFNSDVFSIFDSTPCATVLSMLIQALQKFPWIVESHSRQIVPLFLNFLGYNVEEITSSVASHTLDHKGKEWKGVLKEWLGLFRLLRNPMAFYQGQFLRDVLQYRLLDQNDTDIQMKVLDCLLNWRDDFLLPYTENLRNLINAKNLPEELTRWSLSRTSADSVDVGHRSYIVPIAIRILIPKVRNLKMLACQKDASVHHRRAVLGFLAQLDVEELPLFFWLLIKPLLPTSQRGDETIKILWNLSQSLKFEADTSAILKHFTSDTIKTLSWKKRYGFLHAVEDILAVFNESHLNPFLNLLMNFVVRISASCITLGCRIISISSSLKSNSSFDLEASDHEEEEDKTKNTIIVKQFRDLRSLCLKIIYLVLSKYKEHDFGGAFWDLFFTSVKPSIANFEKEVPSSKKPSSLFCCFLAMSQSYKLVPLLSKGNLVHLIFSMLVDPSTSKSIRSCVLRFTENLLKLDRELGSEDDTVRRVLLPHLNELMQGLHCIFTDENDTKRPLVKSPGKREFTIFNLLAKYVKELSESNMFLNILLRLLAKRHRNLDTCVDVLQIIRQVVAVLGSGNNTKMILNSITPLLISAGLTVRNSICDILDAVTANDSSLFMLAKLLRELNATSEMEMCGLDYDKILCAYEKVNAKFFYTIQEDHVLPILAHAVHDMSSKELILRQSAFRLLLSFVEFSGEILKGSLEPDQIWSEASILHIVNNFFLKHMGNAMNKEGSVKKVWIDLLREMVLKLPERAELDSYRVLCSDDAEQDFFNNIVHLQKHRRARALSRFSYIVSSGNLTEVITDKVLVPLVFSILFDAEDGKDEHIRSACVDALASISGCMNWEKYYALLLRCFRDLTLKPDKRKLLLRLICYILDRFHFSKSYAVHVGEVCASDEPVPYTISMNSSLTLRKCTISFAAQTCLQETLLPMIRTLLTSDSDNVNVYINLVALKLLKLLSGEIMHSQLPTIVHRISNFLKNRLESIRDEARSALSGCLKELGLEYLQLIVKVLKSTLKRGYELHVLGYTLNFLLSKFCSDPICGKLDYCLDDLLSVVENDILGDVSEEKEVEKIASKMKETRMQKSYETLKLIAQNISFKTHALKLLSPVTIHLHKQLTQKVKLKLESMLNHIAAGIECNPSVNQTELFVFVHCLIKDGISGESNEHEIGSVSREDKLGRDAESARTIQISRLVNVDLQFSHLITAFALGVLHSYMKKLKLDVEDGQLLSLLDPFVSLLAQCSRSKYENIIIAALRCLSMLVRLPLRSLQLQADKIKNSLLVIAQDSVNASSQLTESCMKLLTTLLRSTRVTLSSVQLHMLIQFPLFVDFAKNPSSVSLSLLNAIVHRKLVVPEIYDLIQIVAELMVQCQDEPIRKKCNKILLQFLLGYHLSKKRLQQHLDFFLTNLSYQHSTGREAVLEMLHAIILKFQLVDAQSQPLFVHLVISLANDDDRKVRSMSAAAIKCLIGNVSKHSLDSILKCSLSWYFCGNLNLCGAAAQVLGLLLEVIGKGFQTHLCRIVPVMRSIFRSAADTLTSSHQNLSDDAVPFWKEAYYSLVLLEKILHQFRNMFFDMELEDIWVTICEFLLHPHLWLRNISCRILSSYFAEVTDTCRGNCEVPAATFFLMKPSILFHIAVSLCCQLRVPSTEGAAGVTIKQNLVFSICGLHSLLEKNENMNVSSFWSNLHSAEQDRFLRAFGVLDPRKGRRTLESFISDASSQHDKHQHPFIFYLLQRMGKTTFQMEVTEMKIVFNCFKSISPKLLGCCETFSSLLGDDGLHSFAYQLLLPLYRVCEGYSGKVVPDDLKQLAQEVCGSIRDVIGVQNFVQIYSRIRKSFKAKRDKRKQEEKVMAVVNPTRNAKRKLRIAAKHQAYKKRKTMAMKMGKRIG